MNKQQQIHKLVNSLKYKFFKVVYLILKNSTTYRWFIFLAGIVQYFQYTYLNFGLKVQYVWNDLHFSNTINILLKYFTITIQVNNIGYNTYLTVMYFCFGLIIFTILLFLLLAFVIKNKKLQRPPLILLKFLLKIILTFGFWPIVRMQIGFLACQYTKKGDFVMTYQKTQKCWASNYNVHAVVAIIGLIITISFALIMAFLAYESRRGSKDPHAMRNGRCYVQLLVYVFVQIFIYQLLATPQYTSIIIGVFFIGSALIFQSTYISKPYYDPVIQKLWSILTAINFWTIIMMMYSAVVDGSIFAKSIICWLVGMPLIAGILLTSQHEPVDLMVANFQKLQNGDQVVRLCDYLQSLLHKSEKNQRSQILLDGYTEVHKSVCQRSDCVIKVKDQLASKFQGNPIYTDRRHRIKELINQIYEEAVKTFPDDINLRLNYIYFLYDEKKNFQIIIAELGQALEYKPALDLEFHIYRYRLLIEEESEQNSVQFDLSSIQKQGKELIDQLEHAALQIIDFWISLAEEIPDLNKLMNYGFKMQRLKEDIDVMWNKLELGQSAKNLNFMAKFYAYVINDDEIANQFSHQLWNLQINKQQQLEELEEVCNQSTPTLVSTAQFEKVNIIIVNKSLCSMLGYSKADLIGRSINYIIPEIYANPHSACLENFIANKEKSTKQLINQTVFLKTKSNYILPIYSTVRLQQASNTFYFISQYIKDFSPKHQCIILLNHDAIISHISPSCLSYLNLDIKKIEMRKINIKELFPDFNSKKSTFLEKSGGKICLQPHGLKFSTRTIDTISISEIIDFQCFLSYIEFPCLNDHLSHGMIVRLEKLKVEHNTSHTSLLKLRPLRLPRVKIPTFSYLPPNVFQMDYLTQAEIEVSLDISIPQQDNVSRVTKIIDYFLFAKRMSSSQKHIVHLDSGIKTKRYWQGLIVDIEDDAAQMEDEEEEFKRLDSLSEHEDEKEIDLIDSSHSYQLFQSKSLMSRVLTVNNVNTIPVSLRLLKFLIGISLFIIYILAVIVFLFNLNDDQQVKDRIVKLSLSNRRISSYLMISTILQDLRLLNYYAKVQDPKDFANLTKANYELLNTEIQDLQSIHDELVSGNANLNSQYQQYQTEYNSEIVELMSFDGTSMNYTYKVAIDQLISRALALNQEIFTKFNDSDVDFFYFNYNALNSVTKNYQIPLNYHYYQIKSLSENSIANKILFLILQTMMQAITFILMALYLINYNLTLHQIYILFFEITDHDIKSMVARCEQFLGLLSLGEDEQDDSIAEQNQQQNIEQDKIKNKPNAKQTKRQWRNSNSKFYQRMTSIFFIFIFLEAYFIYQYYSAQLVVEAAYNLSPILNTSSLAEANYRFGDNAIRELFVNPNARVFSNSNVTSFIQNYFPRLDGLNAEMQTQLSQNMAYLQTEYINAFQQIYVSNPCPIIVKLQKYITLEYCETFFNSAVAKGLSIGITKYFESLRLLMKYYKVYSEDQASDGLYSDNPLINYGVELLQSQLSTEIRAMDKIVIRYSSRYLTDSLEQSISDSFDQLAISRGTLFSCFTFYIFFIVIFVFVPSEVALIKQLQKSRSTLLFIPMSIMMKQVIFLKLDPQKLEDISDHYQNIDLIFMLIISTILIAIIVLIRYLVRSRYNKKFKMLILFGSGGHTYEMLMTLKNYQFKDKCQELYFVYSDADSQEPIRVTKFMADNQIELPSYKWITIPRSRKVKQSYISSVLTTIKSVIYTFFVLLKLRDIDIFITNGPGTCIPIVIVLIAQYVLFLRKKCKILFIESWCRVDNLSLSGKLAYWVSDKFVVNWESLKQKYKGAIFVGNLI